MLHKRKGKIYNLRVNKDNPEEFMIGPIMFSLVGAGLMFLLLSFIIV